MSVVSVTPENKTSPFRVGFFFSGEGMKGLQVLLAVLGVALLAHATLGASTRLLTQLTQPHADTSHSFCSWQM